MGKYTKNFSELTKRDTDIAGGKGASLGEMLNAGIPVPDGYVVLADTFDHFLAETDLTQDIAAVLDTVDTNIIHTVEDASEKIQGLIKAAKMPEDIAVEIQKHFKDLGAEYVAVRSSATAEDGAEHAWAGQLSSYLNTTKDNLLEKVQDCWASLFTPRAIFYRYEKKLHDHHISVAVVVQKMVNSEKSGIAFSVHPVTEDYNQLIIEAGLGLGEAIVSGAVTPDAYVVEKEPRQILDINVNEQNRAIYRSDTPTDEGWNEWKDLSPTDAGAQVIDESQIEELSEQIISIEKHYGFPCDIEWAFADGKFYITQSRPITTLQKKTELGSDLSDLEKYPIKHYLSEPLFKMGVWALFPSDSMSWHGLEGSKQFRKKFGFGKGLLLIHVMEEIPKQHAYVPISHMEKIKSYVQSLKKDNIKGCEEKVLEFYKEKQTVKEKLSAVALSTYENVADAELIVAYRSNRDLAHSITTWDQLGWLGETVFDEDMKNILVGKGIVEGSSEYHSALFTLTKPEEISTTLEEKTATLKEARDVILGKATIEDVAVKLADAYGWMPVFTFGTPWDSKYFEAELTSLTKTSMTELKEEISKLEQYSKIRNRDFKEVIKKYDLSEEEAQLFVDFGLMLDARNEAEYVLSFAGFYLLPIYEEIAKRLEIDVDDLRRLTEDEIVSCLEGKSDIQKLLSERKEYFTWGFNEDMSEIIFFSEAESKQLHDLVESRAKRFGGPKKGVGICASPGSVTGIAKVLHSPSDNQKVNKGDILIAKATTVDYLPAMKKAAAFVTESGGLTCHAAVVAREFGVPCVVSLEGATKDFADGDEVEVDADSGVVRIVSSSRSGINPSRLQFDDWKMFFSGKWSVLTASYWADLYTGRNFSTIIDRFTRNTIILIDGDKGLMGYFRVSETDLFSQNIYNAIANDEKTVDFICSNVKQKAKSLLEFIDKHIGGEIAKDTYLEFQDMVNDYYRYHIMNKYAPEAIPVDKLDSYLKTFEEARLATEVVFMRTEEFMKAVATSHAKLTGHCMEQILATERSEFEAYLDGEKLPDKDVLDERIKCTAIISIDGEYQVLSGKDVVAIQKLTKQEPLEDGLKGVTAYGGKVSGTVRVVHDPAKVNEFNDGDILIAKMTRPDYLALMKKSSAFVTDAGGVLSHAAIVARELKKPCIIGTQNATQVLKDGMEVEVDANEGVVKILNQESIKKKFTDLVKNKEDYNLIVTRPYPPLLISGIYGSLMVDQNSQFFYPDIAANQSAFIVGADVYYLKEDEERYADQLLDFYTKKENFLSAKKKFQQTETELFEVAAGVDYQKFAKVFGAYMPAINVIYVQDKFLALIHSLLKDGSTEEIADRLVDELNLPLRLNYYREAEYDLATTKDITAHGEKYRWLLAKYGSREEYTIDAAKEKLEKLKANNYLENFVRQKKKVEQAVVEAKNILGPEKEHLVDLMQWLVWFRTQRTDVIARAGYLFGDGYKKLGSSLGLSYEDVLWITHSEALSGANLTKEEIEKRKQGCTYFINREVEYLFTGKEHEEIVAYMKDDLEEQTELIGNTASLGNVTGTVRLIQSKDDLVRVNRGDIIVTTMTTPNMVPAMEKAAAFVTDEGGITCHAAIISREMNKPCVIGTKIATKILKEGDTVQVDADKGIVKVLQ